MSAFMVPEYEQGDWFEIEPSKGESQLLSSQYFNGDVLPYFHLSSLKELDGESVTVTRHVCKWGVRLSAPGYLDCTEWAIFDTEAEARKYVEDTWEVDADTGEDLTDEEDEHECEHCGAMLPPINNETGETRCTECGGNHGEERKET